MTNARVSFNDIVNQKDRSDTEKLLAITEQVARFKFVKYSKQADLSEAETFCKEFKSYLKDYPIYTENVANDNDLWEGINDTGHRSKLQKAYNEFSKFLDEKRGKFKAEEDRVEAKRLEAEKQKKEEEEHKQQEIKTITVIEQVGALKTCIGLLQDIKTDVEQKNKSYQKRGLLDFSLISGDRTAKKTLSTLFDAMISKLYDDMMADLQKVDYKEIDKCITVIDMHIKAYRTSKKTFKEQFAKNISESIDKQYSKDLIQVDALIGKINSALDVIKKVNSPSEEKKEMVPDHALWLRTKLHALIDAYEKFKGTGTHNIDVQAIRDLIKDNKGFGELTDKLITFWNEALQNEGKKLSPLYQTASLVNKLNTKDGHHFKRMVGLILQEMQQNNMGGKNVANLDFDLKVEDKDNKYGFDFVKPKTESMSKPG